MLLIAVLLLLGQFVTCEVSITFPNVTASNELLRMHAFYQPSPLVDSIASLGIHAVIDLFKDNSNIVLSPLNIFSCLDILQLGADGETRKEINSIVGNSKNNQMINKMLNALSGTVHASAVFFDRDVRPKDSFARESYFHYRTEVVNLNFDNGSEATASINRWVAQKTNGTIRDLLRENVDPETRIVVVNALIFSGRWLHPFSPLVTEIGRFDLDDHNFVNVPLMHMEAYLPVIRRTHYDAIGLSYKDSNLIMYLVLPRNQGIDELKKILYAFSSTDVKHLSLSSISHMTNVVLPKFKIDGRFSLKDPLVKIGMKTAFSPGLANFTNFSEKEVDGLFVSDIYHSVHIEVNEHETIASAASAAIFTKTRYFQFKATRPFIFLISDRSGLLLFMGIVTKPEYA